MSTTRTKVGSFLLSHDPGVACGKENLVTSGVLHLRPFNIDASGALRLSDTYHVPADAIPLHKRALAAGDILFNNTNSAELVGKSALIQSDIDAGFSNHMNRLRVDWSVVVPAWFAYWLRHKFLSGYFANCATRWVSQAAYKVSELRELYIDLPSLSEQRRIVDLLSRAESIVRMRREAEAKAKEIVPALFLDMFGDPRSNPRGWSTTMLGSLLVDGPKNGLYKHASLYGEGTQILRIDSFYDGFIDAIAGLRRVRVSPEEQGAFSLEPGDIVVNRVNSPEYLGKSAIVPALAEPVVFESNMMRLRLKREVVLPDYVIQLLQLPAMRRALVVNAKHAINQSSINQGDVKSLIIPVPPVEMQMSFSSRVRALRVIQELQTVALRTAESAFRSLLAGAFLAAPEASTETGA